jgi:hypothetical protein
MEYVIDRLEGKGGLLRHAMATRRRIAREAALPLSRGGEVADTLLYLNKLARDLPDPGLTAALGRQVGKVVGDIQRVGAAPGRPEGTD